MAIDAIGTGLRTLGEAGTASQGTGNRSKGLDSQAFLRLLTTQLQNQNPLEPTSTSEFMGELANFSSVQGMQQLSTSFQDLLRMQQITQGAGMIGREVVYQTPGSAGEQRGVVQGVSVQGSQLQLQMAQGAISLNQVHGIAK